MRRSPAVVTFALLALLAAGAAQAQPAQAPATPAQTVPMEACVLILTAYGPVPSCVVTDVDPVAANRSVADYLTNGAGVLAMPSSGPGAEYFHDGAHALAASTTSWVPTFFSPAGPPLVGSPAESTQAAPAGSAPAAPEAQATAPPGPPPPAPEGPRPAASSAVDQTPNEPPAPPAPPATAAATTPASPPTSAPVVLAIPVPIPVRPWDPAEASESDPMKTTDAAAPRVREPHWELVGAGTVILAGVVYLVTSFIARRRMRPLS
jgi:hypothetical protein